jgi:hypothetical protein
MVKITKIFTFETIRRKCGSQVGQERQKKLLLTDRIRESFLAAITYLILSFFFLFGVVISRGDVAQSDWSIPLTASAAISNAQSQFFVWLYNGFGSAGLQRWGFPFFPLMNGALAPLGFFGGTEVKMLAVFLVTLGGITAYLLAKSFSLGGLSSFLAGLFYMTTPVVFNWLMFGYIFYLIAYGLLPLAILFTKKFLETNDLRYALINGIMLSIVMAQPTFILVYPPLGLLFVLFESRGNLKIILRGLKLGVISLSVWFLTALSFFTSYNHVDTLSFYYGGYYNAMLAQFGHLSSPINPIRLWGSTFNYQFETYFPNELTLLSFVPVLVAMVGVLLRPRDRRVLFFLLAYLFTFASYESYVHYAYLVFNLPYGSIFEVPSIFLVPASLGLALLIGYANQDISRAFAKFCKIESRRILRNASFIVILILIISAGIPWWSGQTSGNTVAGPAVKLNLYQIPSDYVDWSKTVGADNEHFVLYLPGESVQIMNTSYFSQTWENVNGIIFYGSNNLPYVSQLNSSLFLNELLDGNNTQLGEKWGSESIKYIVVYTNVLSYNISDILGRLSMQSGIVKVKSFDNVVVYENEHAKPIVYADSLNATTQIIYQDPTTYKVQANATMPYFLKLNQVYSEGWTASINGTKLTKHVEDLNGFNSWYVDDVGNMIIDIYYEPQTTYVVAFDISIMVIILVSLYVVIVSVRKVRWNRNNPK